MVKIGHARSSETKSKNGVAGDQTGNEVSVSDWYNAPWLAVFRPKNEIVAEKIASFVEKACVNDLVGYSQNDRLSLFYAWIAAGKKLDYITHPVNCDCSSLVACACINAGLAVKRSMTTDVEEDTLISTNAFEKLTQRQYIQSYDFLKRGDILWKNGHTAVVLTNGSKIVNSVQKTRSDVECKYKNLKYNAVFYCTTDCNMREFPSLDGLKMCVLPKGHEVRCYGYYNVDSRNINWLYVETSLNGIRYYGFVSKKCLLEKDE
jgi:hypothetical protein